MFHDEMLCIILASWYVTYRDVKWLLVKEEQKWLLLVSM